MNKKLRDKIIWYISFLICLLWFGAAAQSEEQTKSTSSEMANVLKQLITPQDPSILIEIEDIAESLGLSLENTKLAKALWLASIATNTKQHLYFLQSPLAVVAYVRMVNWHYDQQSKKASAGCPAFIDFFKEWMEKNYSSWVTDILMDVTKIFLSDQI